MFREAPTQTHHAARTSNGTWVLVFVCSDGAPWHDRPVYGAMSEQSWEDIPAGHGGVGYFGNVEVILKDSVLERSTVTFGDSGRSRQHGRLIQQQGKLSVSCVLQASWMGLHQRRS